MLELAFSPNDDFLSLLLLNIHVNISYVFFFVWDTKKPPKSQFGWHTKPWNLPSSSLGLESFPKPDNFMQFSTFKAMKAGTRSLARIQVSFYCLMAFFCFNLCTVNNLRIPTTTSKPFFSKPALRLTNERQAKGTWLRFAWIEISVATIIGFGTAPAACQITLFGTPLAWDNSNPLECSFCARTLQVAYGSTCTVKAFVVIWRRSSN